MRKTIILAVAFAYFGISCQKENSIDTPNQRTDTAPGNQLARVVTYSGPSSQDSIVVAYSYDLHGKLTFERSTFVLNDNGSIITKLYFTNYYRDESGRIVKFTYNQPTDVGTAPDSITETVTYRSASSTQIAYLNDSSRVYEYNVEGKVSKTSDYSPLSSGSRKLLVYHTYTYDAAGNMAQRDEYTDHDGDGHFELNISYKFGYDNQTNPLYFADDAMIEFKWYLFASPNNLTKFSYEITDPRGMDDEANASYRYRMDGTPASSTYVGNGQTNFSIYYYQ